MSKGKNRRSAVFGVALLAIFAITGCSGKAAESQLEMPKSEKEAAIASSPPGFGDAVNTPAIELNGWTSLIAYKKDGHGSSEAEGGETSILRAGRPTIESLEESERRLGGELKTAEYLSSRFLSSYVFSRKSPGQVEDRYLVLKDEGGVVTVEGENGGYRYARTAEGGIRIESTKDGSRWVEEYRPDGSSLLSRDGVVFAEGGTRMTTYGFEYFEREKEDVEGITELFYSIKYLSPDRYRCELGSVEPLALILIEGLSSIRTGEAPLRDIAVLDRLMGPYRRVTPLLALAYFEKLPAEGK